MKKCRNCGQLNVREQNGIAVSKYCGACKKAKLLEKKEKHKTTKCFQNKLNKRLKKKAWALISEYIRRKDAKNDLVKCYTCPKVDHYKNMHCGHLFHGKLDLDPRNLKVQCSHCNLYLSGNHVIYVLTLIKDIGVEQVEALKLEANIKGNNYSNEELEQVIETYSEKLKGMEL